MIRSVRFPAGWFEIEGLEIDKIHLTESGHALTR